ncbi:MAG: hypothetical protein DMG88_17080 [Acidobacteria bacterium]|nr:MAG: hypothetical protein DMG88_17080 [Acidobacteriota bacterium]
MLVYVLQCLTVGHTLTIRITDELLQWLKDLSRRTGVPMGRIIRQQLESAKNGGPQRFLRHAGAVSGAVDLSSRKGFSRG